MRAHCTQVVNESIEFHGINRMEWPARSPDMNCIEHVCDQISKPLNRLKEPVETLEQLGEVVREIWMNVPQDFRNRLIQIMPARVQSLIL
ncbi:hypothetical protein JTB14_029373 [Gonioctena quinquepunctata]|nr:hypothetical protein JTB14_029373 [Gonioctena quinquepunctata]